MKAYKDCVKVSSSLGKKFSEKLAVIPVSNRQVKI